jgi:hypothetical protein
MYQTTWCYIWEDGNFQVGSVIAQTVRCWLSTAAAQIRARDSSVWFVVDSVALEQVSSEYEYFRFQFYVQ